MKNVNYSGLRHVVWTLLIISVPVFAQERGKVVTEEMQKEVIRQQSLDQIRIDKAKFVEGVVGRWITLTSDNGAELRNALMSLADDRLADANGADTMEALNESIFGTDQLGSNNSDLVFNKVTPCRIIDTRLAGGIMVAGVPRNFDATGPFSAQGGALTNCGLPGETVEPAALVLIIVAVNPAGNGNLRAYPKDEPAPNAVVINYSAGLNLANTAIVPLKQNVGDAKEFTVGANVSNTHVVADVVGYFSAPVATPLACFTYSDFQNVSHGSTWNFQSPACPSTHTLTGGGVDRFGNHTNVWYWRDAPNNEGTAWQTTGTNQSGAQATIYVFARCCRIPGL